MRFGREPKSTPPADTHERIAGDYAVIFENDGTGHVRRRVEVLRAVLRREGHFTPDEIARDLESAGGRAEPEFVAQVLESFVRYGLVSEIRTADQPIRYEHVHLRRHHDHAVCVRCGRIEEIDPCEQRWSRQVERSTGFRVLRVQVQLRGLCPGCLSGRSEPFPLSRAGAGERLEVVRLEAEGTELKHLINTGLRKGARVEVLSHDGVGGSIIAVEQSRTTLARSAQDQVIVRGIKSPGWWARRTAIPLTELEVGGCGRIVRIRGHGPMRHRLLEMGITRGATVFVERVAPLGDPIEVTVRGYYLAIRKDEAAQILVEP